MSEQIQSSRDSIRYGKELREKYYYGIVTNDPGYSPATAGQIQRVSEMVGELRDYFKETLVRPLRLRGERLSTQRIAEAKFDKLARQWRSEATYCSTVLEMAVVPAYQQIIGMGRVAIPYILRDLAKKPEHWFWALKAITGEDPVPDEDRGDLEKMTRAWLLWGMVMNSDNPLETIFPSLRSTTYEITSPPDAKYNCIAWAAGDEKRWWEPDPMGQYYWPASAPRKYTIEAYTQAFQNLGYVVCDTNGYETGCNKVALFCKGTNPTHASRQLLANLWTSKLGRNVDISHELHAISGDKYGSVKICMKRASKISI